MSERENNSIAVHPGIVSVRRVARNMPRRRIFALPTLAALFFATAGPSRAQAQNSAAKSALGDVGASTSSAVAPPSTVKLAQTAKSAPAAEATSPEGQFTPRGQQEGIKVHGHWTIEVRNPDGSVATRREFENALASANIGSGGAGFLAAVLGREATVGSWQIALLDLSLENDIFITEQNSAASAECPGAVTSIQNQGLQGGGAASCSNTLSVTGPKFGPQGLVNGYFLGGTLTLTGSSPVPVNFPASISYVQTGSFLCLTSDSPAACMTDTTLQIPFLLTQKHLDGDTVPGDPLPVPVTAGQTVSVTVVISFQ